MREFKTGATRDSEGDKLDYEGFLAPSVLYRYAEYMHVHRHQADGSIRDSDNWQKGIPRDVYMKSLIRHTIDLWRLHRSGLVVCNAMKDDFENLLCAIMFNSMGLLHEFQKRAK